MRSQRRPSPPSIPATMRAVVAGTLLIAAVGSCELPKPHLPSIGAAPFGPAAAKPAAALPAATSFARALAVSSANVGARVVRT